MCHLLCNLSRWLEHDNQVKLVKIHTQLLLLAQLPTPPHSLLLLVLPIIPEHLTSASSQTSPCTWFPLCGLNSADANILQCGGNHVSLCQPPPFVCGTNLLFGIFVTPLDQCKKLCQATVASAELYCTSSPLIQLINAPVFMFCSDFSATFGSFPNIFGCRTGQLRPNPKYVSLLSCLALLSWNISFEIYKDVY